jgi:hypothetical protein
MGDFEVLVQLLALTDAADRRSVDVAAHGFLG